MTKQEIIAAMGTSYQHFIQYVSGLDEQQFTQAPDQKWSAGQQADHLVRSVRPVGQALMLPGLVLRWMFGKPNRPGRNFEQLVAKYQLKLQAGGRASGPFVPKELPYSRKQEVLQNLEHTVKKLQLRLERCSEEKLDQYLLPHPLLGKLTLREMMYFTIYHATHHLKNVQALTSGPGPAQH